MTSLAFSQLTISSNALADNFRLLLQKVGPSCSVAGVVKADGYGLGVDVVVPALEAAGCSFFYVAQPEEALVVRSLTDAPIAVLGGMPDDAAKLYRHNGLLPVLNTPRAVEVCPDDLGAIWHIDTGMNRLGLDAADVPDLLKKHPAPAIVMTHFSSSDEADVSPSQKQVALFDSAAPAGIPQSVCNSSGIFRNSLWHRQQVRPGMALYGLNPTPETTNPMKAVVTLKTRILQIRNARQGETAGYNRTYTLTKDTRLATVGLGYADGFLRSGSNKASLYWNGQACPILGRVSMDLIIVDISKLSGILPQEGHWLDVIGPSQDADALAGSLGTIGYEVLTSLGGRAERIILS